MAPSRVWQCNIILFTATSKLFVCVFLLSTLALAAVDNFTGASECNHKVHVADSDAREQNLYEVRTSLLENVGKTGYNISSHGEGGDRIYGLAQCRGDLNASICGACVAEAANILGVCNNYSGSIYLMKGCFFRYETYSFYSKLSDISLDLLNCSRISTNSTDPKSWLIANLLTTAINDAVNSNVGYGTKSDVGNYALAQCWRDLRMDDCKKCLQTAYNNFQNCLQGSTQRVALFQNCMIRYETYKFFGDAVLLPSPPSGRAPSLPPSPSNGRAPSLPSNASGPSILPSRETEGKSHLGLVVAGVVVAMVVVLALVLVAAWKRKVIQRRYKQQPPGELIFSLAPFHKGAL